MHIGSNGNSALGTNMPTPYVYCIKSTFAVCQ